MIIKLKDLLDGKFRFYLNNNYRNKIFTEIKNIYKDWRIVAKNLKVNTRNLFGCRRGWEYINKSKTERFISSEVLKIIISILKLDTKEVSKNITKIKLGKSGRSSIINLPFEIDLSKQNNIYKVKRALAEHKLIKETKINLSKLQKDLINEEYIKIKTNINEKLEKLRLSGLKPIKKDFKEHYEISFSRICRKNRTTAIIPKQVIFDEYFAKQFGKWLGDRCGGKSKLGVANKNWIFIKEFKKFLKSLNQKNIDLYLTINKGFKPNKEIKSKVNKIIKSKTQYGNYAYRVEISNKIFKNLVFDVFENNIFNILYNSKPSVRYAFYAGFIEAEGSIIKNSKNLAIAFGLNIKNKKSKQKLNHLLNKVIKFKYLLSKDGFNPRISRKVCKTEKSYTIKYDIILLNSIKTRTKEIKFIKGTIYPYLTHADKIKKFNQLEEIRDYKTTK